MENYTEFYKDAYQFLESTGPMLFDCGSLCSAACCSNNGKGMLLFPHEEDYLISLQDKFILKESVIIVSTHRIKILYCDGTCNRSFRPLSCRIFPMFPYTYRNGQIKVDFDPRAKGTCPLLFTDIDELYISGLFRLKILKTAAFLKSDSLIYDFLLHMTSELETYRKFML